MDGPAPLPLLLVHGQRRPPVKQDEEDAHEGRVDEAGEEHAGIGVAGEVHQAGQKQEAAEEGRADVQPAAALPPLIPLLQLSVGARIAELPGPAEIRLGLRAVLDRKSVV